MLLLTLLACAGGAPTDTPDATGDTGVVDVVTYDATWSGVQAMFDDHCVTCHPATNGVDLVAEIDTLVVPGDPAASDLWEAVGGTSISIMMPPSGRLPAESVAHVETWILDGAPRESR